MWGASVVLAGLFLLAASLGAEERSAREGRESSGDESPTPEAGPTVEDFAWMAGHWRGEGFGGTCEEIWSGPLGGSMVGLFRLVREEELVFSEHMMLVREPEGIVLKVKHFTPEFVAWEDKEGAVRFRLEELRPHEAIFSGLKIRRTDEALEIVLRMKSASGEARDETLSLHRHP